MRNLAIAIAIIGVTLAGAPVYAASSVIGSWKIVVTAMQGAFPATIIFAETAEGFAVTIEDGGGALQISAVSVGDKDFSFRRMMDFGQGPQPFVYSGSVNGDTMSGKVESSLGPMTITGTRIEAESGSKLGYDGHGHASVVRSISCGRWRLDSAPQCPRNDVVALR